MSEESSFFYLTQNRTLHLLIKVEILDATKNQYIKDVIAYYGLPGGTGAWMGLGDAETEGTYVWETSGTVATYFDW